MTSDSSRLQLPSSPLWIRQGQGSALSRSGLRRLARKSAVIAARPGGTQAEATTSGREQRRHAVAFLCLDMSEGGCYLLLRAVKFSQFFSFSHLTPSSSRLPSRTSFVCQCAAAAAAAAAAHSEPPLLPVAAEGPDGRLVIA